VGVFDWCRSRKINFSSVGGGSVLWNRPLSEITRQKHDPDIPTSFNYIPKLTISINWYHYYIILFTTSFRNWTPHLVAGAFARLAAKYKQTLTNYPDQTPKFSPLAVIHNFFHSRLKFFLVMISFLKYNKKSKLIRICAVSQTDSLVSKIWFLISILKTFLILKTLLSWERFFLENIQVGFDW